MGKGEKERKLERHRKLRYRSEQSKSIGKFSIWQSVQNNLSPGQRNQGKTFLKSTMRLRAELEGTKRLLEISRVLMKVSKSAIILLSPSSFRIAINDSSPTLMKCWTGNEFALFRTYKVESKNANQIAFEIDLSSFERALRSTAAMSIIQDVPIDILGSDMLQEVQEPEVGNPMVKLISPPLKTLLNNVDSTICITGNMAGELEMEARTDFAFMNTTWKDLGLPQAGT
eukprot:295223-Hanusia_phi.AAC.1